jgi:hypothetical protein
MAAQLAPPLGGHGRNGREGHARRGPRWESENAEPSRRARASARPGGRAAFAESPLPAATAQISPLRFAPVETTGERSGFARASGRDDKE